MWAATTAALGLAHNTHLPSMRSAPGSTGPWSRRSPQPACKQRGRCGEVRGGARSTWAQACLGAAAAGSGQGGTVTAAATQPLIKAHTPPTQVQAEGAACTQPHDTLPTTINPSHHPAHSRDARQPQAGGHRQVECVVGGLEGDNAQVRVQCVAAQVHLWSADG